MFLKRLKILMDEHCQGKQSILAQRANLPKSVISSYFSRGSQPSLSQLVSLSNALGCSIDYLAGLEPDLEDDFGNVVVQNNSMPELRSVEKDLLACFRKLPEDLQRRATSYLKKLVELNEEELSPGDSKKFQ